MPLKTVGKLYCKLWKSCDKGDMYVGLTFVYTVHTNTTERNHISTSELAQMCTGPDRSEVWVRVGIRETYHATRCFVSSSSSPAIKLTLNKSICFFYFIKSENKN